MADSQLQSLALNALELATILPGLEESLKDKPTLCINSKAKLHGLASQCLEQLLTHTQLAVEGYCPTLSTVCWPMTGVHAHWARMCSRELERLLGAEFSSARPSHSRSSTHLPAAYATAVRGKVIRIAGGEAQVSRSPKKLAELVCYAGHLYLMVCKARFYFDANIGMAAPRDRQLRANGFRLVSREVAPLLQVAFKRYAPAQSWG